MNKFFMMNNSRAKAINPIKDSWDFVDMMAEMPSGEFGELYARVAACFTAVNKSAQAVAYVPFALVDKSGKTFASSNRHAPDSFVGQSYAFRPYFKQAAGGITGRYFAVGVTSKVPGYYVSRPIRDSRAHRLIEPPASERHTPADGRQLVIAQ